MENNIEEDIKILEEFKTNGYSILLMKYEDRIKTNRKIDQALEHIVSDYKRVLKENEILKEEKEQAWEEWNNLEQGSYQTEQNLKKQLEKLRIENDKLRAIRHETKYGMETTYLIPKERLIEINTNKYIVEIENGKFVDLKEVYQENEELRAKWDKDTHILQNKLDYANADRIDLAQQNKELKKENEELNYKLHSKKIALEIYNRYIPKSKVKDKIEELDKEEKRELKGTKGQDRYYIKQKYMYKRKVLEDLLREE